MNRAIIWTTRFKKDYKRMLKRHMDINLLDDVIRALSRGEVLPEKTKITTSPVTGPDTGNAIFSPIGFSSTTSKTTF